MAIVNDPERGESYEHFMERLDKYRQNISVIKAEAVEINRKAEGYIAELLAAQGTRPRSDVERYISANVTYFNDRLEDLRTSFIVSGFDKYNSVPEVKEMLELFRTTKRYINLIGLHIYTD